MLWVGWRASRAVVAKQRLAGPVAVGPVVTSQMLAAVRDLLANGMNPIEGLEQQSGVSGKGVRGSGHLDTAVVVLANGVKPDGSASQVTGDVFEPSGLIVIDELGGMNGKVPSRISARCSSTSRRAGTWPRARAMSSSGFAPAEQASKRALPLFTRSGTSALSLEGQLFSFSSTLRTLSDIVCARSVRVPNFSVVVIRGAPISWTTE